MTGGLLLIAVGLVLFSFAPVDGSFVVNVLPVMVLLGTGAGIAFPAIMTLAMAGVAPSDSGLASGLVNTSQQVGGALGLAVLATLSTSRSESLVEGGSATASALVEGYQLAFLVGAGLVAAAIAVALAVLARRPAEAPLAPQACPAPASS
jgi:sugar phosphate permease